LNGAGKSSLLKIMAGVDTEFNGETILSEGYTVGYLEQEPLVDVDKTVREVVEEGVQETVDLLKEFEDRINMMQFAEPMDDDAMDKLIQRQGEVQEKLDALDAWDLDARLEMAMDALRCPPADTPVKVLSGGESGAGWPVPAAAEKAGHPAAGRAHQPSGRRERGLAGASPAAVPGNGHRRDP
jgi:sulfate-transporting ATPase